MPKSWASFGSSATARTVAPTRVRSSRTRSASEQDGRDGEDEDVLAGEPELAVRMLPRQRALELVGLAAEGRAAPPCTT